MAPSGTGDTVSLNPLASVGERMDAPLGQRIGEARPRTKRPPGLMADGWYSSKLTLDYQTSFRYTLLMQPPAPRRGGRPRLDVEPLSELFSPRSRFFNTALHRALAEGVQP
jgi:hypothetical protein